MVHIQLKFSNNDQTKKTGITPIFCYSWLYIPFKLFFSGLHILVFKANLTLYKKMKIRRQGDGSLNTHPYALY